MNAEDRQTLGITAKVEPTASVSREVLGAEPVLHLRIAPQSGLRLVLVIEHPTTANDIAAHLSIGAGELAYLIAAAERGNAEIHSDRALAEAATALQRSLGSLPAELLMAGRRDAPTYRELATELRKFAAQLDVTAMSLLTQQAHDD